MCFRILKQLELELETLRQQTLEQRILEQVQLRLDTAQQATEVMLGKMSQALEQEERLLSKIPTLQACSNEPQPLK